MTAGDLAEYAAHHLAPYKRPSQIVFVSYMPLTPTGKVVKTEFAKMAANGVSAPLTGYQGASLTAEPRSTTDLR